jgi:hypothetical protein
MKVSDEVQLNRLQAFLNPHIQLITLVSAICLIFATVSATAEPNEVVDVSPITEDLDDTDIDFEVPGRLLERRAVRIRDKRTRAEYLLKST